MSDKDVVLAELEPLFKEAEEKHLWFHCEYQDLWYSPAELREHHKGGAFIWGRQNWELKEPMIHLRALKLVVASAQKNVDDFRKRMGLIP